MRTRVVAGFGSALALALSLQAACGGDTPVVVGTPDAGGDAAPLPGTERGACYPNGTCNVGLTCLSDLCVKASADAGADVTADADAAAPSALSCTTVGDGRTNCGNGSESCCTSLPVVGGTYNRTYWNPGSGPTGEADPATVSDFRLDKYEVTVGRFRSFVAAWNGGSGWTPPAASGKHTHLNGGSGLAATGGGYEPGWATSDNGNIAPTNANLGCSSGKYETWTPTAGAQEKLPANCVNWYEAAAFCIWDGGFLPSEAEWEYAAAGGSQERAYPWGPTAPGTANQYAIYGCNYPSSSGSCTGVSNFAPVGTPPAGAGWYGQMDLAGNVWEWNLDWFAGAYGSCTNCTSATVASFRTVRGGSHNSPASYLPPPFRNYGTPTQRSNSFGFRCARTP